jgi:PAS domain S-box-containing protein
VLKDSPSWRDFTGQTADASSGWGWLNAVHPDDRREAERAWRAAVSQGTVLEMEYRLWNRAGAYRWTEVRAVPVRNDRGLIAEWVGMNADISERKRHEAALLQSEEQFRVNFEMAAVGQMQLDAQTGCFIRVNDRFCGITGYSREELMGMTPHDLMHPDDRPAADPEIEALLRGEREEYRHEKRYVTKQGAIRWVRVLARLIRDPANRPVRTISVVEDITERKEAEAALWSLTAELERRVAERTKELTDSQQRLRDLAGELNLAEQRERRRLAAELHDYLAQLLVVGRLKLSQALQKISDAAPRAYIQEADEVLDRSLTYTRSLVAQLIPPVLEQFGLSASLLWLGDEMRRRSLTVEVNVPREAPPLSIDQAALLYQSTRELLMNVLKHSQTTEAEVTLTFGDGRPLVLTVADHGAGFDPAVAQVARDKFGLFSIRERMQVLGGSFAVESSPGGGTMATLTLPLGGEAAEPLSVTRDALRAEEPDGISPSASRITDYASRSSMIRVLLVDDHAMVREGLKSVLSGYPDIDVVGEGGNGEEATALARELDPHIVVMDVNMPKMDGIEATRRITQDSPGIIVVGLSVNASSHVAEAMRAAGAATLLTKESAADLLYQTIKTAVAKADLPQRSTPAQETLPFGLG